MDGVLGPLLQMAVEFMQPLSITRSRGLNQIIVSRARNFDKPLRPRCSLEQAATQFQRYDLVAVAVEKQQRRADFGDLTFRVETPAIVHVGSASAARKS